VPSIDKIKQVLFTIDCNKNTAANEFDVGFFNHCWHIIDHDFPNCVLEFFKKGRILRESNHTFITLVPKIKNLTQTSHFQPINLCSTLYKIAKILVNQMRPFLDKIISPFQRAFIPGRLIHDNSLLTHEIVHQFKKHTGKTSWVAVK